MKIRHTNYKTEDQLIKILFYQSFLFQIQLEKYQDSQFDNSIEVQEVIRTIDLLMETILKKSVILIE